MQTFTYQYRGVIRQAEVEHFTTNLYNHFRIFLPDGTRFSVSPKRNLEKSTVIYWVQKPEAGILFQPDDLIVAIGEGLEAGGIY